MGGPTQETVFTRSPSFLLHPPLELNTTTNETTKNQSLQNKCSWEEQIPYGEVIQASCTIFRAIRFTGQTGILGLDIPQGLQQGDLYSLHLNANDNTTA